MDPGQPDSRKLAGAVALLEAVRAADRPYRISPTLDFYASRLRHGWDGDPPIAAVTTDPRGRVIGVLEIWLYTWDNLHAGYLDVLVDPAVRRQGLGGELFAAGLERLRSHGRTLVLAETFDRPSGVGFAKAMGLDRASEEVLRRQDLTAVDWPRLDADYAAAEPHAAGYELLRLAGAVPDDLLPEVVRMTAAINDAPTDDLDIEDEVFTPERVRAFEAAQEDQRRRCYRVVARERATGAFAGHTQVAVDSQRPWQGWQNDTSVLKAHRGHRLGLLLKVDMLRWLAEEEPQLRVLDTGNSASNSHMIKINEQLGYRVVDKVIGWQRHL